MRGERFCRVKRRNVTIDRVGMMTCTFQSQSIDFLGGWEARGVCKFVSHSRTGCLKQLSPDCKCNTASTKHSLLLAMMKCPADGDDDITCHCEVARGNSVFCVFFLPGFKFQCHGRQHHCRHRCQHHLIKPSPFTTN